MPLCSTRLAVSLSVRPVLPCPCCSPMVLWVLCCSQDEPCVAGTVWTDTTAEVAAIGGLIPLEAALAHTPAVLQTGVLIVRLVWPVQMQAVMPIAYRLHLRCPGSFDCLIGSYHLLS